MNRVSSTDPDEARFSGVATGFADYWRFPGLGKDLERVGSTLPLALDMVAFSVLAIFLYRTAVAQPHWLGFVVLAVLVAYGWNVLRSGAHVNSRRLMLTALICYFLGIVMPLRIGEPMMVMSFFVMLGSVAVFMRFGTRVALGSVLLYVMGAMYLVVTREWGDGSVNFALSGGIAFAGAAFVLTLLLYNYMFVAQFEGTELQAARDSMARIGSLGHIGYYSWDQTTEVWEANEILRELLALPVEQFPVITVDMAFSRVAEDIRADLELRLRGDADNDFVYLALELPDGRVQPVMAGSKVFRHVDGHTVRHGFMWATDREPGVSVAGDGRARRTGL